MQLYANNELKCDQSKNMKGRRMKIWDGLMELEVKAYLCLILLISYPFKPNAGVWANLQAWVGEHTVLTFRFSIASAWIFFKSHS